MPVHIVAFDRELDARGSDRWSPHALVQEYLNRSDALWGIVTNGRRLRLLRDTTRVTRPTYLEVDLEGIVAGGLYAEFAVLWRLLHRSRFPNEAGDAHTCLLERWYQKGIEEGGRVREQLRVGVEKALLAPFFQLNLPRWAGRRGKRWPRRAGCRACRRLAGLFKQVVATSDLAAR